MVPGIHKFLTTRNPAHSNVIEMKEFICHILQAAESTFSEHTNKLFTPQYKTTDIKC